MNTGRRFVHVKDIVRGIISSIGLRGFNTINLTGKHIITLKDIIETSEKIFDKKVVIKEKDPTNISIRNPSNKKAKELLKWEPRIGLEEGIKTIRDFI